MNGFASFDCRYLISGNLVLDTPMHIGKGASLEPIGTDLPVVRDHRGLPFIPGSSIKGVVRSTLERLVRSLTFAEERKIRCCDPFDQAARCRSKPAKDEAERLARDGAGTLDDKKFSDAIWNETCTVCRIFGSPWLSSRVFFKDAPMLARKGDPRPVAIRDGVAIDRDTGTVAGKAKFDYEVVSPGLAFDFRLVMENVELWEAGLVALVLSLWERGQIAIGGKGTSGMGWGKVYDVKAEFVDRDNFLEYILHGNARSFPMDSILAAGASLVVKGTGNAQGSL